MSNKAPQIATKKVASTRRITVDLSPWLEPTETLTGDLSITATITSPTLTISSAAISSAELIINGATVAAGKAVTFLAASGRAAKYTFYLTCDTTGGQLLRGEAIGTLINE